jgi:replication factor A1
LSEIVKIKDLTPNSKHVNLVAKVVEISESREVSSRMGGTNTIAEALMGDETGTILMTLWNENISKVAVGDVVSVTNGYVNLFRGSMRLNVGKYGSLEKANVEIPEVNKDNNVSSKQYSDQRRRYRGSYGGRERRYSDSDW